MLSGLTHGLTSLSNSVVVHDGYAAFRDDPLEIGPNIQTIMALTENAPGRQAELRIRAKGITGDIQEVVLKIDGRIEAS